ncbi:MAG: lysylphosphatidylglycerol synthase transmembrane domain-containing protein [Actinomycetota bacterium]
MLLIIAIVVIVFLSLPAPGPTAIDSAVADLLAAIPGLLGWFWEISYDLLFLWTVLILGATLFAHGRKRLLTGEVLAGLLGAAFAAGAGGLSGTAVEDSLRSFASSEPPAVYPAVRLAVAVAMIVTASPHLSRPLRYLGRWILTFGAIATIALGVSLPIGVIAGLAAGLGAASLVHLALGSPGGRLTLEQIEAALRGLGVEATDVAHVPLEPSGVALATASASDGRSLLVKVYGRDAWDGQLIASTWSSLWNRGEAPRLGGRLQQVEHESFVSLFADREGVSVLPVVAAGMADGRDAVLVIDTEGSRTLASLTPTEVDDALVADLWAQLGRLHALGMGLGEVDADRLVVRPDGSAALADLSRASLAAPLAVLLSERAQLLVVTALVVGHERAVSIAANELGADGVVEMLPYLQPAVLDRATRHAVRDEDWSVDDLRELAAHAAGVDEPELEQLHRVTIASIAMVVIIALVAYAIISAVANVGLDTLIEEFEKADLIWIGVALLLAPSVGLAQGFATVGACIRPVRLGPVILLQYGIQFIGLAVPSSAARIALEIRFFQRVGLSATGAVAVGVIDSVCGFVVQILLIVGVTLSGLASLNLPAKSSSHSFDGTIILVGVVVVALLAIVALAVPRSRAFLRDKTAGVGESLRVLRSPAKVSMIFVGNLAAQILLTMILGLCLRAFGHHLTFAELILVNMLVILFAGFMPVPGGMGVAEAGYTAGLVALGVPHAAALSTAMAYRLVTYYLPPIWGAVAMRWLRGHSYV